MDYAASGAARAFASALASLARMVRSAGVKPHPVKAADASLAVRMEPW